MDRDRQENLFLMARELRERRSTDPIHLFRLHPKQAAFVHSVLNGEAKENWFIAANRSGKSDAGAYIGASLARFGTNEVRTSYAGGLEVRDRATSGWVSALDFPTARDVIQPKYFDNGFVPPSQKSPPFIPKHEISDWRVTDQVLKLRNGSLIGFKSADSGRRKYQGSEKDWFHMDEEHPWEIYEESVIRVGSRPLLFFATATILPPEGAASSQTSWVFSKIIQPFQDGRLKHVRVFGASIYDNPGIPRDEISRLESIYPEGSLSRRIRLGGEWLPGIAGARAYGSFDRAINMKDVGDLSMYRPLCWAWDFNVEPMVSLVGQMEGGIFKVKSELVIDEASIPDMCQLFYERFPRHNAEIWVYGDASGNSRTRQTGKTDYFIILNEMRKYGVPLRLKVPIDNPAVPDRINAVNRLCRDEAGNVRLVIDTSCQELASDLEGVLRDHRGGLLKTHNRKDPYFRRTHTSDALGYWIAFEEPVRIQSGWGRRHVTVPTPSYAFGA
jgi:phage terminase large subunit-like protein